MNSFIYSARWGKKIGRSEAWNPLETEVNETFRSTASARLERLVPREGVAAHTIPARFSWRDEKQSYSTYI